MNPAPAIARPGRFSRLLNDLRLFDGGNEDILRNLSIVIFARTFIASLVLTGALNFRASAEDKPDAAAIEFFENKVRPVLVEHCYKCHSDKAEKLKGGLYVDSREGILKGGDNGPAIVPGDPDKSLLIKAVRYTDDNLQMPPKNKKLSSEQIADLEHWVKIGAPAPVSTALAEKEAKKKK